MRIVKNLLILLAAGVLAGAASPAAGPAAEQRDGLRALQALDARVLTVGHRLAVAAADLCVDRAPLAGMAVHDLAQYDPSFRNASAGLFGLGAQPGVLAVVPDGPAARAGVRADDAIVATDGVPVASPRPLPRDADFATTERLIDRVEAALADGVMSLALRRGGATRTVEVRGEPGCRARFQIVPDDAVEAGADGRYVQISSAFAEYAASDGELVATLAHELAHNILRHRARLDAAKVERGLFGQIGRNARLIRATEVEADRLSVWLIDRAGYSVETALDFWRRYRRERGLGIFTSPTHPGWKERIAIMEAEAAELAAAKRSNPRPIPPILRGAPPPLD